MVSNSIWYKAYLKIISIGEDLMAVQTTWPKVGASEIMEITQFAWPKVRASGITKISSDDRFYFHPLRQYEIYVFFNSLVLVFTGCGFELFSLLFW